MSEFNFSNFYTTSRGIGYSGVTKMSNGYEFYFKIGEDVLAFPITPSKLNIKVGSNNKVVTMINEGDINILKSPSLIEVEFEARFPMRKYPYSREVLPFKEYFDKFKELKEGRKSFRFIVVRATSSGIPTWDTDLLVALEDFKMSESADEGDDVLIDFKLKQYKEYGIKILPESSDSTTTSTSEQPRPTEGKGETSSVYVVQSGDCLWNIAKAAYGNGARYTEIYQANKEAIEADARKHGKASSENGHWIWAGLKLTIPGIDASSRLKVTKL